MGSRCTYFLTIGILTVSVIVAALPAAATEDYAADTGQECSVCHVSRSGGGGLTASGEEFRVDPDSWQPPLRSRKRIPTFFRLVHLAVLYIHILFGVVWVGTILYVHLVLKPKYAVGGLPKSELRLAWVSMPLIGVTGILLTAYRIRVTPSLFSTMFGRLLAGKIAIFALMVVSAAFVTLFIGPRLKRAVRSPEASPGGVGEGRYTVEALKFHDGSQGDRILVSVQGQVWDVSSSPMWKGGLHAGRHRAGQDMTEYLKNAPHGPEVLERYSMVGDLYREADRPPAVVRVFTLNAYFNLVACTLIILILALWRW